jgi:hypothetical protein
MATSDNFDLAKRRADETQSSIPKAEAARYDHASGRIVIRLSSRLEVSFSPHDAQGLQNATPPQLEEIEITPSGFGIHFPQLDADLYIPGLLEGFLGSKQWMASRLGQLGGKSRSVAKAAAAAANGKLGGDPKSLAKQP